MEAFLCAGEYFHGPSDYFIIAREGFLGAKTLYLLDFLNCFLGSKEHFLGAIKLFLGEGLFTNYVMHQKGGGAVGSRKKLHDKGQAKCQVVIL